MVQYGRAVTGENPPVVTVTLPIAMLNFKSLSTVGILSNDVTTATYYVGINLMDDSATQFKILGSVSGYQLLVEWLCIGY